MSATPEKHIRFKLLLVIAGLLLLPGSLWSQQNRQLLLENERLKQSLNKALQKKELWRWDTFRVKDGLTGVQVFDIFNDNGTLYLATGSDLNIYDGLQWSTLNTQKILGDDWVVSVLKDRNGDFWFGTNYSGVMKWRDGQIEWYNQARGLISDDFLSFAEDESGAIWVGTANGLNRIKGGVIETFTREHGLRSNVVTFILPGANNRVWIGTNRGLNVFQDGFFKAVPMPGAESRVILSMCETSKGVLWVGTRKEAATLINGTWRYYRKEDGLIGHEVWDILESQDGKMYFAVYNAGASMFDGEYWYDYNEEHGLAHTNVMCLSETSNGAIWFGTNAGLSCFNPDYWTNVYDRQDREGEFISARLYQYDPDHFSLWTGTVNGIITRFDINQIAHSIVSSQKYSFEEIADYSIHDLHTDSNEVVFAATDFGIYRYNGEDLAFFGDPSGKVPNRMLQKGVYCIMKSGSRMYFGGLSENVFVYDSETTGWTVIDSAAGLASDAVRCLEEIDGALWIGTFGSGLAIYEPGRGVTRVFSKDNGLANGFVQDILLDSKGLIWVATEGGISRISRPDYTIVNYTANDGLASDDISSVAEDRDGNLWFGTFDGGISFFDRNSFQTFNKDDGLRSNVAYNILKSDDGTPWFCLDAKNARVTTFKGYAQRPETFLQIDNRLFHTDVDGKRWYASVVPSDSSFSPTRHIKVAGMSFSRFIPLETDQPFKHASDEANIRIIGLLPYRNLSQTGFRYSYDLNDRGWTPFDTQNEITLQDLENGVHTLRVRTRGPYLKSDATVATYRFDVDPPLSLTFWLFLLAFVVAAVPSVVQFIRWRKGHYIGPYKIIEKIGSGGMGIVYKARSLTSNKIIALKVIHQELIKDVKAVERFKREGEIVSALKHPNIVGIFERGHHNGRYYISMEYINGFTVRDLLGVHGTVLPQYAVQVALAVCRALREIHHNNIIHRDLKSENIIITSKRSRLSSNTRSLSDLLSGSGPLIDNVKVMDFGLARSMSAQTLTKVGTIAGTIAYMSPQQALGRKIDERADIYSLGIVLYEMLTGQIPFRGEHDIAVIHAIVNQQPKRPSEVAENIPAGLEKIVLKAIAKKEEDRFQSIDAMITALEKYLPTGAEEGDQPVSDQAQKTEAAPELSEEDALLQSLVTSDSSDVSTFLSKVLESDITLNIRKRLTTLYEINQAFIIQDADQLVDTLMDKVIQTMNADRGFLMLTNAEGQPELKVTKNIPVEEVSGTTATVSRGVINKVMAEQKSVYLINTRMSEEFNTQASILATGVHSIIAVPLKSKDRLMGLFYLDCQHSSFERKFSELDVNFLENVAVSASIAIQNARSFKVIEELNRTLENRVTIRTRELEKTNEELKRTLTELKRTEAMLVHSEKMTALGQMIAGIAHEINNPVSFVYGNMFHLKNYIDVLFRLIRQYESFEIADALQGQIRQIKEEIDYEYVAEDVEGVIKSCIDGANRIRNIVLDLRTFSRLDESVLKEVNLIEGIESTLRLFMSAQKTKIEIHTDFKPIPPLVCYANELNQVFMNLIVNAADAIKEKGNIWLSTDCKDNTIIVSVRDDGEGIPENIRKKVFDPFFTTKGVGQGTGLGLSISYEIIHKHNGSIELSSEIGKGTRFEIRLPVGHFELS